MTRLLLVLLLCSLFPSYLGRKIPYIKVKVCSKSFTIASMFLNRWSHGWRRNQIYDSSDQIKFVWFTWNSEIRWGVNKHQLKNYYNEIFPSIPGQRLKRTVFAKLLMNVQRRWWSCFHHLLQAPFIETNELKRVQRKNRLFSENRTFQFLTILSQTQSINESVVKWGVSRQ